MRSDHRWFLVAIAFLVVGTVIGFTQINQNLEDHKALDRRACQLALDNRRLLRTAMQDLEADPALTPETSALLHAIEVQLSKLIAAQDCTK